MEEPADQQLFNEGIDQLIQNQDPEILLQLQDRFPESPWSEKVNSILGLAEQINRQKQQVAQLNQQLKKSLSNTQKKQMDERIKQCTAEAQRLQQELDISNKRLEALRELSIELELKQP